SDSRNMSAISATASTFSGFAMALLPEVSRHRVKGPGTGKGLDTQVSRPARTIRLPGSSCSSEGATVRVAFVHLRRPSRGDFFGRPPGGGRRPAVFGRSRVVQG